MTSQNRPSAPRGRAPDDIEKTDLARVFAALATPPEGLSAAEASSRLQQYGRNELADKEVGDRAGMGCNKRP